MTKERAEYILAHTVIGGDFRYAFSRFGGITYPDGITEEEDKFIRDIWETMPGYTNYFNAVHRIAKGELEIPPKPNGITPEAWTSILQLPFEQRAAAISCLGFKYSAAWKYYSGL